MSSDDEIARAARKSREWRARKAEIEAARREDAEAARQRRAAMEQGRQENYHAGVWRNVIFAVIALVAGIVFFEQQVISDRANKCLAGAAMVHQYGCAGEITRSIWFWMLPSDQKALLRGSAS